MAEPALELFETVRRDVRHAARALRRSPVFTLVAAATLAVGIGAAIAVWSVLDAVVLRPLAYPEPDRLVSVLHPATVPGMGESRWGLSAAGYFHFSDRGRTLADLGAYVTGEATITGDGDAETVRTGRVTHTLLPILGAQPAAGRLLLPDDDVPGAAPVALLGYDLWQRRYGGDPGIVGQRIQLHGGAVEIVGVTARGFNLPRPGPFAGSAELATFRVDLWFPLRLNPAAPALNSHPYSGIGRLAPGASAADAQRELAALTSRFPDEFPSVYSAAYLDEYGFGVEVSPLRDSLLGPTIPRMLWLILGAVVLVLAIALANVGNLFLVRSETRAKEVAIRAALGASRSRLVGHALAESLLLAALGGLGAVVIAAGGLQALVRLAPRDVPRLGDVHLNGEGLVLAIGVALAAGLAFAAIPMLRHAARAARLREGTRGAGGSGASRGVRDGLVVVQVAMALVLLVGAGLMVRSFAALRGVHPGLEASGVSTFELLLPRDRYPDDARTAQFHRTLQERIAAVPGVRQVGATTVLPLRDMGTACRMVFRPDLAYPAGEEPPCVPTPKVTPGFFQALGIPVRGRIPEWRDAEPGRGVAVVTAELAQRLWPGQDPLGRTINSSGSGPDAPVYRIVGVVHGLRGAGLDAAATEAVFYPPVAAGDDGWWSPMRRTTYVVSASPVAGAGLAASVRQAVRDLDDRVAVANPMAMEDVLSRSTARVSFILTLMGVAAGIAMLLSAVGLYGVVSYLVSQRRGEIGIRMALGARETQVARMILMQSVRLAVAGAAIGLVAAVAGTRLMRALLYEVSPTDPLIFAAVAGVVLVIAIAASIGPAWRAARIPPAEVLGE